MGVVDVLFICFLGAFGGFVRNLTEPPIEKPYSQTLEDGRVMYYPGLVGYLVGGLVAGFLVTAFEEASNVPVIVYATALLGGFGCSEVIMRLYKSKILQQETHHTLATMGKELKQNVAVMNLMNQLIILVKEESEDNET